MALQALATPPMPACSTAKPSGCIESIYFDSGEGSAIRPEWLDRVKTIAFRLPTDGHLRLDAYTDRSGPAGANRRIARQRADAVRAALLQLGANPVAIAVVAHGEDDPLVPTPDGVREPQNRRVDLTIIP
ncbi:OmpA family protein [Sphingomonas ginsengisoli (ex An et al. 2013)]|uniref:OmpA family protein n=1 Tax=Sphingomonas ginsengisoli (ex An et al. 2013) TaxID=363835 RepID=UPI001444CCAA|nr:OmpA family protein [Sphingomonas ginsengisoli An et al. 2013]